MTAPDQIVLSGLMGALGRAGLVADGGGYNQHVDATVLCFRGNAGRLELISAGQHPEALRTHLCHQPAYRVLDLMTGAWETQAVAAAAELHVFDHLVSPVSTQDVADRCSFVAGDFTSGVPDGGDVYLLSRILPDWDDQQCQAILKRCAGSMPPGATLLIVERLLPEQDVPSLAFAWDIHMLCDVGGRERTPRHYRQLLEDAGFTLSATRDLPLDFSLLLAKPV